MLQLLFQRANTHILEPLTALAMDLLINNVSYTVVAEDMRKDIRSWVVQIKIVIFMLSSCTL